MVVMITYSLSPHSLTHTHIHTPTHTHTHTGMQEAVARGWAEARAWAEASRSQPEGVGIGICESDVSPSVIEAPWAETSRSLQPEGVRLGKEQRDGGIFESVVSPSVIEAPWAETSRSPHRHKQHGGANESEVPLADGEEEPMQLQHTDAALHHEEGRRAAGADLTSGSVHRVSLSERWNVDQDSHGAERPSRNNEEPATAMAAASETEKDGGGGLRGAWSSSTRVKEWMAEMTDTGSARAAAVVAAAAAEHARVDSGDKMSHQGQQQPGCWSAGANASNADLSHQQHAGAAPGTAAAAAAEALVATDSLLHSALLHIKGARSAAVAADAAGEDAGAAAPDKNQHRLSRTGFDEVCCARMHAYAVCVRARACVRSCVRARVHGLHL